jgi:hypothetical protein
MSDKDFGCEYKTRLKDYVVSNRGKKEEQILFPSARYRETYCQCLHLENLKEDVIQD